MSSARAGSGERVFCIARLFFIFHFSFFTLLCIAQQKVQVEINRADELSSAKRDGRDILLLKGSVAFRQADVLMYCDSAYQFKETNSLTAYGHVHIIQNDSINLYGDKLDYDGNTRYAIVYNNVTLQEGKMTLKTDRLDYDMANKKAFYTNKGVMHDVENHLTSQRGYYYPRTHDMYFSQNVVLVNPSYILTADTLQYNTLSKKTFFHGPTNIVSKKDFLYCETGWYNTINNTAEFGPNSYMKTDSQYLFGDSLYYDRNKSFGKAIGHVRMIDSSEKMLIEGGYAEDYGKSSKTFVTQHVLATKGLQKDSMYLTADTLKSGYDSTGKYHILHAFQHVRIYNKQFQAKCDTAIYSFVDSTIDMRIDPIMWFDKYQATSKRILVHTKNNRVYKADFLQNAFLIMPEDTVNLRFSQVKGRDMYGHFKDNELNVVDVIGNGESIYYVKDESKKYIGVNKIVSSNIRIGVKDRKISTISFIKSPDADLLPVPTVGTQEGRLPGFKWRTSEKPKSKEDLLLPPGVNENEKLK